jgi:hypothetical protein
VSAIVAMVGMTVVIIVTTRRGTLDNNDTISLGRAVSADSYTMVDAVTDPTVTPGSLQLAEMLNQEGKELMFADRYTEAAAKFSAASEHAPKTKYLYNLCIARYQIGLENDSFGAAITACNAAATRNPTGEQLERIDKMIERIRYQAKRRGIPLSAFE